MANSHIDKLQKRVEQYSTEATVYQEGDDRISIEIPGVTDANQILDELGSPALYILLQRKTAREKRIILVLEVPVMWRKIFS